MLHADEPAIAPADADQPWGGREAILGWLVSILLSSVASVFILKAAGYTATDIDKLPLWLVAVLQVPLWVGLVGAPLYAVRSAGHSLRRDFGFAISWVDVPVGLITGVICQVALVPLLSYPWLWLWGKSAEDLGEKAEQLASRANDPLGIVLLVLIVAIGAPIIEELFYRGLVFRSLRQKLPAWPSIVFAGLIFGAVHFEYLQFPALAGFGMVLAWYAHRTGRLGGPIMAHLAFNGFTVWYLVR